MNNSMPRWDSPTIKFKKTHPDVKLPTRSYEHASGYDLYAFVLDERQRASKALIPPSCTRRISTGLLIEPPAGYTILVCSRSGLAMNSHFVANSPGVVDPDFRGAIDVLFYNGSMTSHYVQHDDRIAQLIIVPQIVASLVEVEEFSPSLRGESGYGSTGR